MPRPQSPPIGLQLSKAARLVSQAFERELVAAGSSLSTWQVLLLVRSGRWSTQTEMASALGVTPATLTHHLGGLEDAGLVRRWREADNRRIQQVELTADGEALFDRLRGVALRHDRRLRNALSEDEISLLADLLEKVSAPFA